MAHIEDNLLTIASGLLFGGSVATEDEVMSPTTDRLAVYLWLTLIDARLPAYVARMYALTSNLDDSDPDIEDISATLANQVVSQCNTNEQCNTTNVDTPEIVRKVESDTSPFFTPSITITHVG